MGGGEFLLAFILFLFVFAAWWVVFDQQLSKTKELLKKSEKEANLYKEETQREICNLQNELSKYKNLHETREAELNKMLEGNLKAFPYLAGIMADYLTYDIEILAKKLDWGNSVERAKKVASIREIRRSTAARIEEAKVATYQLQYLLQLYPSLQDVIDCDFGELDYHHDEIPDYDPVRKYLSKDEYYSLSESERNQKALDNYIQSHAKTKWQIGRDYELYVGYQYERKGYNVEYFGSNMGLNDLGRDLICKKRADAIIVQCKYWSQDKTIHEKHIFQLFGTVTMYRMNNAIAAEQVKPVFVTNISLSDTAKKAAAYLNVEVIENYPLGEFPRIKCNVSYKDGAKTKIYHLPMDQQYDKVKIIHDDECFAYTVKEAESKGFRRAYKWHGES